MSSRQDRPYTLVLRGAEHNGFYTFREEKKIADSHMRATFFRVSETYLLFLQYYAYANGLLVFNPDVEAMALTCKPTGGKAFLGCVNGCSLEERDRDASVTTNGESPTR